MYKWSLIIVGYFIPDPGNAFKAAFTIFYQILLIFSSNSLTIAFDIVFKNMLILSDDSMCDDDVPNSAVDLVNKDRFLKKSLRIERVAEEVKLVLKPHYNKKHVTKEEYKDILRKAVPKVGKNKFKSDFRSSYLTENNFFPNPNKDLPQQNRRNQHPKNPCAC